MRKIKKLMIERAKAAKNVEIINKTEKIIGKILNIAKPKKRQLNRVPVKARRHRPFAWQKRKLQEQPDTL